MFQLREESHDSLRRQYTSSKIIGKMRALRTAKSGLILGVADVDLFVPELNFVFGEADTYSDVVIISLSRLRQEFYGLQPDRKLLRERVVKEAIHELGHACGLDHCDSPYCVMYFSNSIDGTFKLKLRGQRRGSSGRINTNASFLPCLNSE
jgi:archaemetzincin